MSKNTLEYNAYQINLNYSLSAKVGIEKKKVSKTTPYWSSLSLHSSKTKKENLQWKHDIVKQLSLVDKIAANVTARTPPIVTQTAVKSLLVYAAISNRGRIGDKNYNKITVEIASKIALSVVYTYDFVHCDWHLGVCCIDCHNSIIYMKMAIVTCKIARVNSPLEFYCCGTQVRFEVVERTFSNIYREMFAINFLT